MEQLVQPCQPKKDVFDSPEFNSIQLVNQLFPDESSLSELETFADALRTQVRIGDKEIFRAVKTQGGAHARARQELELGQSQILDLFQRITKIQTKAEESENVVQDICRDIRKLDCAKRNLTNSITSMRRLAMLTSAITDLEACADQHQSYKRAANLVEAVHQLMEHFQQFESMPKVLALAKRLGVAESALQQAVLDDFKLLLGTVDVKVSQESLDRLGVGCLVVEALGPKVRDQLMDWLAEREMKIYQLFIASGGADTSKLDRFERRFQWFCTRLEERKAEWSIFPEEWRVPQVLCLMFCKITKAHLKRVLSDEEVQGQSDIAPLIKAVVATNKFEKDMAARFGGGAGNDNAVGELAAAAGGTSSVEARKRLGKLRDQKQAQQEGRDAQQQGATGKTQQEQDAVRTKFEGSISEAFESVLHLYVAEEERELLAYLEACLHEEAEHHWKPSSEDMDSKILPSANKIFLKVRSSLTRCVKLISRGHTLLQLSEAFKRVLQRYSQALLDRLPRTASGAAVSSVTYPCVGTDWHVRMPKAEEQVVCRILHTSDFCRETLEALESVIAKDVKPAWADKVDMSNEVESFQAVASQCMNVLVLDLNTRLDASLQDLMHIRWDSVEAPGDHSPYVDQICKTLVEFSPLLGDALDQTSLSFFCDKAGRVFMPRFHDAVGSVKRISDKGALQLSIDCDAILRALLELPRLACASQPQPGCTHHHTDLQALTGIQSSEGEEDAESSPFAPYSVYVQREMGTVNNMMKVVQSKPENLVSTFLLLIPPSLQNTIQFTRVCELKGMSRAQQQQMLAEYKHKSPGASDVSAGGGAAAWGWNVVSTPRAPLPDIPAFKLNMDNITALASSFGRNTNITAATREQLLLNNPVLSPNNPARAAGISAAADAMANKTKDTFSKVGNVLGTSFAKLKSGM